MLSLSFGNKTLKTDRTAFVMGIVNATPDSFFDGSRGGIERALQLVEQGADIIDIGGESTRPGFTPVTEEEELKRVIPLIKELRNNSDIVISVDTSKRKVMEEALECGADIINNVLAFENEKDFASLAQLICKKGASVVLMHHSGGSPIEIADYLKARALKMQAAGISKEKIILDPGIGFGKSFEENIAAMKETGLLCSLGYPLLMALSRKSSLGKMTGREVGDRLSATLAADLICVQKGAKIIRVHDVLDAIDSLNVMKFLA